MRKIFFICLALIHISVYSQDDTTVKRSLSDIVSNKEIKKTDKSVSPENKDFSVDTTKVSLEKKMISEDIKPSYIQLEYNASSFDDVRMTGSYGFAVLGMPWKLYKSLYAGIYFAQFMNYGLVDSKSAQIISQIGGALGYTITPHVTFAVPIAVNMQYVHGFIWGLVWSPSIYFDVYKKFGLYAAPQFSKTFVEGTKVTCGFKVGVCYHL